MRITANRKIYAADGEFDEGFDEGFDSNDGFMVEDPDDNVSDALDDMADDIEDMQDDLEDVVQDDPNIDIDNNIENHLIAECDRCKGIFISAVVESDLAVKSITGICPLCDRETEQYLKWVVKPIDE